MADDPIVGAWELVSDSRVGVSIYTDSHFPPLWRPRTASGQGPQGPRPTRPLRPYLPARPYPVLTPSLDQLAPAPKWPTPERKRQTSLSLVITP